MLSTKHQTVTANIWLEYQETVFVVFLWCQKDNSIIFVSDVGMLVAETDGYNITKVFIGVLLQ